MNMTRGVDKVDEPFVGIFGCFMKMCQDTSCALSQAPSRWQARDTVRTPQRPRLGMSQSAKGLLFLS